MDPQQEKMNFEAEEGIKKSYENADIEWKITTLNNLQTFCTQNKFFSTNEFRTYNQLMSPNIITRDNRAMGGIIRAGVKNGWMKSTDQTEVSKISHGGVLVRIWESLISDKEIIKI